MKTPFADFFAYNKKPPKAVFYMENILSVIDVKRAAQIPRNLCGSF
jgi:hypothetical protein